MSADDVKDGPGPEKMAEATKPAGQPSAATVAVVFDGRIDVHAEQPLPAYDVDLNRAYRAYSRDKNKVPLIALVCERHYVPRLTAISLYKGIINPNMATLVEYGVLYWPPAKQERFVLFYHDVLGKPLLAKGQKAALGWKQEDVLSIVVKPMVNILQDLRDKEFFHGAIRVSNMFDGGSGGDKPKKIILGECLSVSASYAQPPVYEPITRCMSDPAARGRGTLQDDLYAFGVCIAVLMRQTNPFEGLSAREIVEQKITMGSYSAITGADRFKGEILELLRGLLHDDETQRWGLDEVMAWLEGRRLSPKQGVVARKAQRAMPFSGEKYMLPQTLALNIERSPGELKKVVEDQSLHFWLERSLQDELAVERLEKVVGASRQGGIGPGYEDRLVGQVSIALDPSAPMRYKGLHLSGDGIGTALAEAMALKSNITPFAELFTSSIAAQWLANQFNSKFDVVTLHGRFDLCKRFITSRRLGEGIERCVYVLSSDVMCLSETLKDYIVIEPDDLLRAFEDLCQKKRVPSNFLDRHVVAFLSQRQPKLVEPYAFDLNSAERHKVVLGTLLCLANIQKRFAVESLPGVAKALALMMPAVYKRYHDRTVREKLQKNIEDYAQSGDLQKMAALLDNAEVVNKDYMAFRRAMTEFSAIEQERKVLEEKLADKATFGLQTGREWAVIVSCVLSSVVILGTIFMFLSHKTPF